MRQINCDVLVIGGGGGGIRAALAAHEENQELKVVLATKGFLGKSGVTALACSDRMAFHATLGHTEPRETKSWRYHAQDVYEIGGKVSDGNLAAILAEKAEEAFLYLDDLGVPFVKKDGVVDQFITDGSDYARACYTGPKTAVHIEEALVKEIKRSDVEILENTALARLVTKENMIIGAIMQTSDGEEGKEELLVVNTKSIILATGGAGKVFKHNVFPRGSAGDAYALAYEVGAQLVNMEFIQIGIASTKTRLNCSGSAMRAVPRIVNDQGEEFLAKYFPIESSLESIHDCVFQKGASWPVTYEHSTHLIDIAVYKETRQGNKVFLDYSANPKDFKFANLNPLWQERYFSELTKDLGQEMRQASPLNRLKEINSDTITWLKEHGVDLEAGERVEIATCIQHFQGGVKINEKAETSVPGLYAVGECAGGQHGANRPGGNALLDSQVFGKIAGIEAAKRSEMTPLVLIEKAEIDKFLDDLNGCTDLPGAIDAGKLRQEIQQVMSEAASVVRTKSGLEVALEKIKTLKELAVKVDDNGNTFALETKNMVTVAEMILRAASLRNESRGPHLMFANYNDEKPQGRKDPEWQKYIVIKKDGHQMDIEIQKPLNLEIK